MTATPTWTWTRHWLSFVWLDLLIAALVAAAEAAMVVPWLHLIAGLVGEPSRAVPSGFGLFVVGLVSYLAARTLLTGGWDIGAVRAISLGIWLVLMIGWFAVAEGRTLSALWAFIDHLASFDGALIVRLLLGWAAWWRGVALAADPDPFTPGFGRRLVGRSVLVAGAALLLAALVGGRTGDQVAAVSASALPVLLIASLLAAGAMQVRAARIQTRSGEESGRAGAGWLGAAAALTLGILLLAVIAAGVAGRGFWGQVFGPLGTLLHPVQVLIFWVLAGVAFLLYLLISPIFWVLRQLAGGNADFIPQPVQPSPNELRQFAESSERAVPQLLITSLEIVGIVLILGFAAWLALRSLRRYRAGQTNQPTDEIHESVYSSDLALDQLRAMLRALVPHRPTTQRRAEFDLDAEPATVRDAYRHLLALGAHQGQARLPAESPSDYAERLGHAWSAVEAPVDDLTQRYLAARYAEQATDEDTARARADWRAIRVRLSARTGAGPPA